MSGVIEQESFPRVNASMLPKVIGRAVELAGEVVAMGNGRLLVRASDKVEVTAILTAEVGHISAPPKYVMVCGLVNADLTITAKALVTIPEPFDLDLYNEAVTLCNAYPAVW